jgi:uncharacterized protein YijF (DUF1287 family)
MFHFIPVSRLNTRIVFLLLLALAGAPAFAHAFAHAFAFSPERFVSDARSQIGKTLIYDPAYVKLAYPLGDVPLVRGVCTDVVIRALRHQDIDLQRQVHEDMKKHFRRYPNQPRWGLSKPDPNIDHRRVPNLQRYFERHGYAVDDEKYLPGDIVIWMLRPNVGHIGIVSDKKTFPGNRPLVIHNIGQGTQETDILFDYAITGHYRIPPSGTAHGDEYRRISTYNAPHASSSSPTIRQETSHEPPSSRPRPTRLRPRNRLRHHNQNTLRHRTGG